MVAKTWVERIWRRNANKPMLESSYFVVGSASAAGAALDDLLAELNAEILEAHAGSAPALQLQWRALGASARLRLAHCPFLLADLGLPRPALWASPPDLAVHEAVPLRALLANRSVLATPLLRRVLSMAWYLARHNRVGARIALGMSASCASGLASWRPMDLDTLAERRPAWIRPRWEQHLDFWQGLLSAAGQDSPRGLERLQLWGLQKLAAEVRRDID